MKEKIIGSFDDELKKIKEKYDKKEWSKRITEIQKNRLNLKEIDMFVFNIFNVKERKYLDFDEMISVCKDLELKPVPLVEVFTFNYTKETAINELLEKVKGFYDGTKNRREGSVFRTLKETYSNTLNDRLSFKVINNDYLIHDE